LEKVQGGIWGEKKKDLLNEVRFSYRAESFGKKKVLGLDR